MSDFDRNYAATRRFGADRAVAIDAGLRAHMIRVYNYMAAGLTLTGLVALATYALAVTGDPASAVARAPGGIMLTSFGYAMFVSPLRWVVILAPLALVFFLSFRIGNLSVSTARTLFVVYAALLGLSLAVIFLVYTYASISRVFFITAASFGALRLWGDTRQRDLTGFGSFLLLGMGLSIIACIGKVFNVHAGLDSV